MNHIRSIHPSHMPSRMRGLSLVEMMIGVLLGIFLIGGALTMLASNLNGIRNTLLEARINQDLRATADLISRDLKRSGYWGYADQSGTILTSNTSSTTLSPYSDITCTNCSTSSSQIQYNYSKDSTENNQLDINTETFGFKLSGGGIYMLTGGSWQPMTDTNILTITNFTITPTTTSIDASSVCSETPTSTPTIYLRRYDITLTGQAVSDSSIVRTLTASVRVRNEKITGTCPA